jgi:hypothetical protein
MNSKRRAELQRKLSMGAVPRPPADLANRIKADIPNYLEADPERSRFTGSVAFTMRVAASILMLITTAFITLRLLEPGTKETTQMASRTPPSQRVERAVTRYQQPATGTTAAAPQAAAEEVRLEIQQEVPLPAAPPSPHPPAAGVAQPEQQMADVRADEQAAGEIASFADVTPPVAPPREEVVVTDAVTEGEAESFTVTANAPVIAEAAPAPAAATAPTATAAAPRERREVARNESARKSGRRAAPVPMPAPAPEPPPVAMAPPPPMPPSSSLVPEAYARELDLGPPSEVFGISVDPNAFNAMKSALETGKRPPARIVDVDALVNYFAGAPAKTPKRMMLEVEASPAPVEAAGDQALLRFTIDSPRVEIAPRASTPPAASDVSVEVLIDPGAVATFRRIGGSTSIDSETTMLHNVSVTALYQLELKPQLQARQRVATVKLRYRSVTDGRKHMLTKVVHGADLARGWPAASRRHRLASLGAVWSESLKAQNTRPDVAKAAEELASQEPRDERARELANAANATAGGGRK